MGSRGPCLKPPLSLRPTTRLSLVSSTGPQTQAVSGQGSQARFSSLLFPVAARKVRRQVCTPIGWAHNPAGRPHQWPCQSFQVLSTSVPERGPPRLYHVAKSVLKKGAESLQKTGAGKGRDTARRSSERSRCQCLDVKEKHLTSFSRVSPACRRASVLATTMKLETPALSNNPLPLKSPKRRKSCEDPPHGDGSLLVLGLGLAGRGGRQRCWRPASLLLLLHTILSLWAGEEKTLHLRHPGWGGWKDDVVTSLFWEWNDLQSCDRLKSTGTAAPFPSLHSGPSTGARGGGAPGHAGFRYTCGFTCR